MSQEKSPLRRMLPGLIISLGIIAAILYFVDIPKVIEAIQHANYGLLALALAFSFGWLGLRGFVWRTLLRNVPSYKNTFLTIGEGYLLNYVLPFRLGELGRAFLLSGKTPLTFVEILPTIVIERAVDLAFSATILVTAVPLVVGAEGAERIGIIMGGMIVLGMLALFILARKREWAMHTFEKLSQRWPILQRFGGSFLTSFFDGLAVLTDTRLFLSFLFWMTLNWTLGVFQYFILISAFFPQATLTWSLFTVGVSAFGNAIPSLPGAIGTMEGAFGGALTLLSGDQSTALAVALVVRLYFYLTGGVVGAIALSREGETLSGIYKQLMQLRAREDTEPKA